MPIILPGPKILYTAVPKNACTSLKFAFYYLQNDKEFETIIRPDDKPIGIHALYPSVQFVPQALEVGASYWKTAVIRDPVGRLLSCYTNRILYHGELNSDRIAPEDQQNGLTPRPSFDEFVEKLALYRACSPSIKHHTDPHVFFLGPDARYYDRLFKMSELELFQAELIARTGKKFVLGREQRSGSAMSRADLNADIVKRIKDFYKVDYDTFVFE